MSTEQVELAPFSEVSDKAERVTYLVPVQSLPQARKIKRVKTEEEQNAINERMRLVRERKAELRKKADITVVVPDGDEVPGPDLLQFEPTPPVLVAGPPKPVHSLDQPPSSSALPYDDGLDGRNARSELQSDEEEESEDSDHGSLGGYASSEQSEAGDGVRKHRISPELHAFNNRTVCDPYGKRKRASATSRKSDGWGWFSIAIRVAALSFAGYITYTYWRDKKKAAIAQAPIQHRESNMDVDVEDDPDVNQLPAASQYASGGNTVIVNRVDWQGRTILQPPRPVQK